MNTCRTKLAVNFRSLAEAHSENSRTSKIKHFYANSSRLKDTKNSIVDVRLGSEYDIIKSLDTFYKKDLLQNIFLRYFENHDVISRNLGQSFYERYF